MQSPASSEEKVEAQVHASLAAWCAPSRAYNALPLCGVVVVVVLLLVMLELEYVAGLLVLVQQRPASPPSSIGF